MNKFGTLYRFFRQKIIRLWEMFYSRKDEVCAPCDFWLVCHEKDYSTARLTIESIRRFSLNPPGIIYLISNRANPPDWLAGNIKYICEDDISGVAEVKSILKGESYCGWIVQQILKLSGAFYSEKFVAFDCDTVLLQPHLFFYENKTVLRLSYEHSPIYRAFERGLGINALRAFSFVCHMMPFRKDILLRLIALIEERSSGRWYVYIANYAKNHGMKFSEWDLYARFLIQNKYDFVLRPWVNQTIVQPQGEVTLCQLVNRHSHLRLSVSIHKSGCDLVLK